MSKRKDAYRPLPQRETLTPADIAAFLQISMQLVYDLLNEEDIPGQRAGRLWRIARSRFLAVFDLVANVRLTEE